MKSSTSLLACISFVAFFSAACTKTNAGPEIDVRVQNSSGTNFDQVEVRFGKNKVSNGLLGNGFHKTHLYYQYPITSNATVVWFIGTNVWQTNVNVLKAYDLKKNGLLTFDIQTNEVAVTFKPRSR